MHLLRHLARSVALVLCGAQLAIGCSLGAVKTKPRDARAAAEGRPAALCTKNSWSPFLDLGGMLASAVLMVAAIGDDSSVPAALGAGMTTTFGLSAGFGLATVEGCNEPVESADLATR
ncbi:MAG TPA: hypothetical protein VK509_21935 [Polyangiales bacterium]|nr:hypothetical protein [Polyangiales bacterium]